MSQPLHVALIQQSVGEQPNDNLQRTGLAIEEAAAKGAQLILLHELHNTRYFCQTEQVVNFDLAEPLNGPTTRYLADLAKQHKIVIVGSIFERRTAGMFHNTAVVLEQNGELAGIYRKMHIPDDPGYYEKFYFTPGDIGFRPVTTSLGVLGVLVCWDQWFPEAARLMALRGAQLLLYPTAIGWDPADDLGEQQRQREAWRLVQRGHAVANNLPVLCCNRVGFEPQPGNEQTGIQFWGSSFATGPQGELLAEAADNEPAIVIVDVDLDACENVRRIWPFLRDRRVDSYEGLSRIFDDESIQ